MFLVYIQCISKTFKKSFQLKFSHTDVAYILSNFNLNFQKSSEFSQRFTNKHLAATSEHYCHQRKITKKLGETKVHLEAEEHESKKVNGFFEALQKDTSKNFKTFHGKSKSEHEKTTNFRKKPTN